MHDLTQVKVQQADGSFAAENGPYVEPMQLQVVCRGLWERMPDDDLRIDPEDVEQFGNVTKALSSYYAEATARIADGDTRRERAIREWVGNKLITADGIRGQVLKGKGRSEDLDNDLIALLGDAHLVRAEQRSGAVWYELADDRLVGPVCEDNARWHEERLNHVQRMAALWELQGRPAGLLLSADRLAEAKAWLESGEGEAERGYVEESQRAFAARERAQTREWRLRLAAVAAAAILVLVIGATWLADTIAARRRLAEADKRLVAAAAPPPGQIASLDALMALEDLRQEAEKARAWETQRIPWRMRLGLYNPQSARERVEKVYLHHLRRLLVAPARDSIVETLRALDESTIGPNTAFRPVYDALRAYLIVSTRHDRSTPNFLVPVLLGYSAKTPPDREQLALAERQFEYYANTLRSQNPYPQFSTLDDAAVASARRYLSQFSFIETIYSSLLTEASNYSPDLYFARMYPWSAQTLDGPLLVPGAFTKDGWWFMSSGIKDLNGPLEDVRWMLGEQMPAMDRPVLVQRLSERYRTEFVIAWYDLLKGAQLLEYANWRDAAAKLGSLSSNNSRLLGLFCVVRQHTEVDHLETALQFEPIRMVVASDCSQRLVSDINEHYLTNLRHVQALATKEAESPAEAGSDLF